MRSTGDGDGLSPEAREELSDDIGHRGQQEVRTHVQRLQNRSHNRYRRKVNIISGKEEDAVTINMKVIMEMQ